jgi:hypothetical protein
LSNILTNYQYIWLVIKPKAARAVVSGSTALGHAKQHYRHLSVDLPAVGFDTGRKIAALLNQRWFCWSKQAKITRRPDGFPGHSRHP